MGWTIHCTFNAKRPAFTYCQPSSNENHASSYKGTNYKGTAWNDPFLGRFPMLLWVGEIWLLPTTLPYCSLIHMLAKSLKQDKAMTHGHIIIAQIGNCWGDHLAPIALLLSMHCKHQQLCSNYSKRIKLLNMIVLQ